MTAAGSMRPAIEAPEHRHSGGAEHCSGEAMDRSWRSGACHMLGSSVAECNGRGIWPILCTTCICHGTKAYPTQLLHTNTDPRRTQAPAGLTRTFHSEVFRGQSKKDEVKNHSAQHRYDTELTGAHRLSPVCGIGRPISAIWSSHACCRPCGYVPLGKLCGRPPRSAFCRKLPHLRPPASRSVASDSCPSREVQKFRSKLPLRLGSGCLSIIVGNSPQPWRVGGQKSKAEPQNVGDIPPAKNERTLPAPENGREARTSGMLYGCRTAGVGT